MIPSFRNCLLLLHFVGLIVKPQEIFQIDLCPTSMSCRKWSVATRSFHFYCRQPYKPTCQYGYNINHPSSLVFSSLQWYMHGKKGQTPYNSQVRGEKPWLWFVVCVWKHSALLLTYIQNSSASAWIPYIRDRGNTFTQHHTYCDVQLHVLIL